MLVDNEPGVLARVVGLFSGRGYNIESLTVAEVAHAEHLSRITIVTSGTPEAIEQIRHQLERLVPIHRVTDLTIEGPSIQRELAMVKVRGKGENRMEALRLADAFRARVIDATTESFVFELTGAPAQDRPVRRTDAADRPRRGVAHRRRRHLARPAAHLRPPCWRCCLPSPCSATFVAITPGPNNIMLMTSGLNFGFRRTLPHMWGVTLGFGLMAALVGLGLAGVFRRCRPCSSC